MVMMMKDQVIEMMQCGGLKNNDALTSRGGDRCGVAAQHSGFSPKEVRLFQPPHLHLFKPPRLLVKPQLGPCMQES